MKSVFEQLRQQQQSIETDLRQAEQSSSQGLDIDTEVDAALATLDELAALASDTANLGSIGDLFRRLNAQLFLRFQEVQPKKRKVYQVAGGVVTFGTAPAPVVLYEGPTGRRAIQGRAAVADGPPGYDRRSPGTLGFRSGGTVVRKCQSGREDSNLRPHGPEPCALAKLSYAPFLLR